MSGATNDQLVVCCLKWGTMYGPEDVNILADVAPGQIASYMKHCGDGLPPEARIVNFGGRPKPHEVADAWVKTHWRVATPAQDADVNSSRA